MGEILPRRGTATGNRTNYWGGCLSRLHHFRKVDFEMVAAFCHSRDRSGTLIHLFINYIKDIELAAEPSSTSATRETI
jgi:hypothetical protein